MDFPSNSNIEKTPEPEKRQKKTEKVINGSVSQRKKPLGARFRDIFGGEDGRAVMQYVVFEVFFPQAKDMLYDVVMQAIERKMYGLDGARPGQSYRRPGNTNHQTNYNKISSPSTPSRGVRSSSSREISRRARASHDFDEVVFETRFDAERVLGVLEDILEKYSAVTVNDFYDCVEITGNHVDEKWGWTDLRGVEPRRARGGGWILTLPPTEEID